MIRGSRRQRRRGGDRDGAGGEVLGSLVVAVRAAVPTRLPAQMIYAYPTFHRGIDDALSALGE